MAEESFFAEPDADAFLGWAYGFVSVCVKSNDQEQAPAQQEGSASATHTDEEDGISQSNRSGSSSSSSTVTTQAVSLMGPLMGLPTGPPGLTPVGLQTEVQVLVLRGRGRVVWSGKPESERRLASWARDWLSEFTRDQLEARGLHVHKELHLSQWRTHYDMHVHYANDPKTYVFAASPIYLALIAAISGWRQDPTVRGRGRDMLCIFIEGIQVSEMW